MPPRLNLEGVRFGRLVAQNRAGQDKHHAWMWQCKCRGISVCPRWRKFEAFAADMGPTFQPDLELDRIDVNGNYEPSNCGWATRTQQQRNKRVNHRVTWAGRTATVQEWAELLGLKPNTLLYRLRRGWSIDRALTTGASADVLLSLANEPQS